MSGLRPPAGQIPVEPGVYRFRDAQGRVIYVGKARSLRSRLSSYFADPATLHPRTAQMVATAVELDWTVVRNEAEALSLEYVWIKEFDPRFNVKYRDDKSYPFLAVTVGEEFPRVGVVREHKRRGTRYFGPYAQAWAIRDTVDELLKVFPMRSCRDGVFRRARQVGRPCLLGYIGKCSAPCVGRVDAEQHRRIVDDFCSFMAGNGERFIRELELEMAQAASQQAYEEAARLRDSIGALRRAMEGNAVVFNDATDADVVALSEDPLEAGVQVFHVRGGRIRGERSFVLEKAEDLDTGGYVARVLQRLYEAEPDVADPNIPREVLVSTVPSDVEVWRTLLSSRRGAHVEVRVPQRGDKRTLMETAVANAAQTLAQHRLKRASDLTTRSRALQEIQDALGLVDAPLRMECIDVSHLSGQDIVASMVVFEDGLPRKQDYRSFIIKDVRADDTRAVAEVVRRRFARAAEEETALAAGAAPDTAPDTAHDQVADATIASMPARRQRFAYPPGLLVIDGGQPQVRAAQDALMESGITDVPVIGLAKRLEEVWLPDDPDPVILPRTSEGLYLLQRLRDEAHRTAIAFHRRRRGKRQVASALDAVPGLGPKRASALLAALGSVKAIRSATVDELCAVEGIGPTLAATLLSSLGPSGSSSQESEGSA